MAVGVSADVGGFRFAVEERDGSVVELVLALVDPLEQPLGHRTAAHPMIRASEQPSCGIPASSATARMRTSEVRKPAA